MKQWCALCVFLYSYSLVIVTSQSSFQCKHIWESDSFISYLFGWLNAVNTVYFSLNVSVLLQTTISRSVNSLPTRYNMQVMQRNLPLWISKWLFRKTDWLPTQFYHAVLWETWLGKFYTNQSLYTIIHCGNNVWKRQLRFLNPDDVRNSLYRGSSRNNTSGVSVTLQMGQCVIGKQYINFTNLTMHLSHIPQYTI